MAPEAEGESGADAAAETSPDLRLDALVSGWVQGVGFRIFVARIAGQLGLTGWVRNESDGRVRTVAEGRRANLEQLLAALEEGPAGARVSGLSTAWMAASGTYDGFEIRSGSTPGD
jgi:acylphosphatase